LITSIGGRTIRTPGELVASIGENSPGAKLAIRAIRDGREQSIEATLGERDDEPGAKARRAAPKQQHVPSAFEKMGLTLTELSSGDAASLGLTAEDGALVVERVEEEGPAAAAGIQPGDMIRRIGSRAARTLDEATAAIGALREGSPVPVLVEREGRARFVLIRPGNESSDTRR
jgi:serine protease Do